MSGWVIFQKINPKNVTFVEVAEYIDAIIIKDMPKKAGTKYGGLIKFN